MRFPDPSPYSHHWAHDPSIVFLNHGSFGGTPRIVMEAQRTWRDRMERELVKWFVEEHWQAIDQARRALGMFLNCPWDSIAPIPNATQAVATVFANTKLSPGDEVLVTSHEYPACQNNARWWAGKQGATVVVADIPFPIRVAQDAIDAIMARVSPRTKLVMLSHITSSSGLVLPVETIVPELERRGIRTLIDGAHAPGMVRVNLGTLGASYYTANCHKWLCSPKGSAFLYVRPDLQPGFRPLALSNDAEKPKHGRAQFLTEFEYVGTNDMTAFYSIPDAIRVMGAMVAGAPETGDASDGTSTSWRALMRHNRDLCLRGRDVICKRLNIAPPAPDEMIASICTMILPPHPPTLRDKLSQRPTKYHDALWDTLLEKWRIQVPIWTVAATGHRTCRIATQVYNTLEQYEYLAEALASELEAEKML